MSIVCKVLWGIPIRFASVWEMVGMVSILYVYKYVYAQGRPWACTFRDVSEREPTCRTSCRLQPARTRVGLQAIAGRPAIGKIYELFCWLCFASVLSIALMLFVAEIGVRNPIHDSFLMSCMYSSWSCVLMLPALIAPSMVLNLSCIERMTLAMAILNSLLLILRKVSTDDIVCCSTSVNLSNSYWSNSPSSIL